MSGFLLWVEKLPPNVIFMSGPKLKVLGFFWAPQALMQKGGSFYGHLRQIRRHLYAERPSCGVRSGSLWAQVSPK